MDYIFAPSMLKYRVADEPYVINNTLLDPQGSGSSCSRFLAFSKEYKSEFDKFMEKYSRVGIYPIKDVLPGYGAKTRPIAMLNGKDVLKRYKNFKRFDTVVDYSDHLFATSPMFQRCKLSAERIRKEWRILEKKLPENIFVRVYESRMDLLRVVIIGAKGTPYHDGLFFFDVYFPRTYPLQPPNFEAFVVGHFRNRALDILKACKAYMEGLQVGSVVDSVYNETEKVDVARAPIFEEKCSCTSCFGSSTLDEEMKVLLRSVLLLPKQPFLRSVTASIRGSSPFYKPEFPRSSAPTSTISGSKLKFSEIEQTQLGFLNSSKNDIFLRLQTSMQPSGLSPRDKINLPLRLKASEEGVGLVEETTPKLINKSNDSFSEMRKRFLSFKKHKYLENLACYQELAQVQAPKFLVISCADSRVCPSYILGFQPGEAFVVRNVANFVPPFENGPCETNAALEFSVTDLEALGLAVENILVTGHSCCGGIRALMSMDDDENSSFIKNWVKVGKTAKSTTKATASHLSFDDQCKHCEKESINNSLLNLLTYPWVEERVAKGLLSLHGGYYDFVDCTYEKWTLDYQKNKQKQESDGYAIKNREFWS
ncbi:hypothetical protein SSX86_005503 [Deinandra increscens subsp. villosa]|uniref:carbonic anhydrase n=1 Tax=Deinandra increscens subsp. villosa TaxID=3103831 RepID=A0AAP0DQM2_9ASTR